MTMELARQLNDDGFLSRVYTGRTEGADAVPASAVRILRAPRALQAVSKFWSALAGDPARSFLLTLGFIGLAPLLRLRRRRARVVIRIGNTATPELATLGTIARLRYRLSIRFAVCAADAVVVQCRYMEEDLARHVPGARSKMSVIYNFVEDELWSWCAPTERPLDGPYFFCAASMKPQKDFGVLLAAYARCGRRLQTRLVVGGVSPMDTAFDELMRASGVDSEEVIRLGFISPIYHWMAHAEACVLSSRYEGFSNFLLESAALGKKIVATDCPGGNAELFAHYPNVAAVPVGDVTAFAAALDGLHEDVERATARKYLRPFQQDHIYGQYLSLLSGGGGLGPPDAAKPMEQLDRCAE